MQRNPLPYVDGIDRELLRKGLEEMSIETKCWHTVMQQAAACVLLVLACSGCRSYMVALEYDQGKCDAFEAVFGNCNDRCQQCSHSPCAQCNQPCVHCNGSEMTVFSEEPPFMPTGHPMLGTSSGDYATGNAMGPPIRSASFTDEQPAALFLPVPIRPVFAPRQLMAPSWEE